MTKKYFLTTLPYFVAAPAGIVARACREDAPPSSGLPESFPRLDAATTLTWMLLMVGVYEIAKRARDGLVAAFAVVVLFSAFGVEFVKLIFGYDFPRAFFDETLLCHVALIVVCAWMLIRIRKVRVYALPAAIVAVIAFSSPQWISLVSDHATATTKLMTSEIVSELFSFLLTTAVPFAVLRIYVGAKPLLIESSSSSVSS